MATDSPPSSPVFIPFSRIYWLKALEQVQLAGKPGASANEVGGAVATCILLAFAAAEAYVAELPLTKGLVSGVDLGKAQQVAAKVELKGLEDAIASAAPSRSDRKLPWKRELGCLR